MDVKRRREAANGASIRWREPLAATEVSDQVLFDQMAEAAVAGAKHKLEIDFWLEVDIGTDISQVGKEFAKAMHRAAMNVRCLIDSLYDDGSVKETADASQRARLSALVSHIPTEQNIQAKYFIYVFPEQ